MTGEMIPGIHMPECNEFCDGDMHFLASDLQLEVRRREGVGRPKSAYEAELDAATARSKGLARPQREIVVDVQIMDRGELTRRTLRADLDKPEEITEILQDIEGAIGRSTGGM